VVTAAVDEPVGQVRARAASSPYESALVVAGDGTLVGRLGPAVLAGDPTVRAEQVMEAGPTTVRPDRLLQELVDRMRDRDLSALPVTTPEGRLLGVLPRHLAEQTLAAMGSDRPAS
jgi:CBS domain-containing protein